MKSLLTGLVVAAFLFLPVHSVLADVWVNGYYRSNGTYVSGHWRSNPDGNPYNNYSYPGNWNPYTGVRATGNTSTYLNNYYNRSYYNSYSPSFYSNYYSPYSGSSYWSSRNYSNSYYSPSVLGGSYVRPLGAIYTNY